ncbi:uncharacterized protein [Littorina saxatilis]|uniref:Mutator-like transposase domain-containing protein n=1 Tax=Littorina saxatilis TaxID=31220 RepID=A0AAN9BFD4_9CAEN
MVRTKPSTTRGAPKSTKKRTDQVKSQWKAKKSAQSASVLTDVTECVPVLGSSASATFSASIPSTENILGTKTRSEFKKESYERFVSGGVDTKSSAATETLVKTQRGVVDFAEVDSMVASLCCPQCKNKCLSLCTDSRPTSGLAVFAQVNCSSCKEPVYEQYLATKFKSKTKVFDMNRQAVYSSLACGLGATTFRNFCENMDLAGLHHKTFHTHASQLFTQLEGFRKHVFSETVAYVREVHARYCGTTLGVDDTLNIIVSYDGTWLTRGHSSHIGVGCAVDLLTGLCVDAHVMCTYCQVCESTGQKLFQEKPEEYAAWLVDHLDKCEVNYKGSSGMMEVEAARVIWRRSVNTNKLRYTTLLSDGDSKTFTELNDIKPYGEDIHIDKEECVNHVSKRLGTALRNMVTDCRKRGVTLGGRGRGQLTGNAIRKLQIYYNRAIRSNKDVCSMKKAIMASLYHCFSTDENPQHELCPAGESSWCFFQEALAKHQVPGPHKHLIHTPLNEEKLAAHLLPIYERLSEEHLLSRCVSGKTQNANECLHSLIWSRCAKDHFASRSRVEFAVLTAIREFNFGPAAAADSAQFFGFQTGHHMKRLGAARMHKRVRNSLKAVRDKQSKRRDKVRAAKSKRLEELVQLEGGPAYAAGMF